MNKIESINVMHHTHWDREWYETFEEFRLKLRDGIRYVQYLIDNNKIDNFFFDGQTIIIDDYKEIVDEKEFMDFIKYIEKGKIEIGPWYVLADEFLVGGESLLKNLELGTQIAERYNSKHNIGYLPDTFGHISQMPQVLKGYGIENAIIWRGAVSKSFENRWIGSDGSEVLTFVLPLFDGYFQTFMKHDDWNEELNKYIESNRPYCDYGNILVMNGADHTYTSEDIMERFNEFKKEKQVKVREVLMSDFVAEFNGINPKGVIEGEQRNNKKIFVLPGVFSSRMYLKNLNQKCEDKMINIVEALDVLTEGRTKSGRFKEYLWKLLVQNHAHDSICGCSIDDVHDEMEVRYKKILSAISKFKETILDSEYNYDYINREFVNEYLYIINNTPIQDKYIVEGEVIVPKAKDKGGIELYHNDEKVNFLLIERIEEEVLFRNIKVEPFYDDVVKYKIRFIHNFNGVEINKIKINLTKENEEILKVTKDNYIENEYYKLKIEGNFITIKDKHANKYYDGQHTIISSLDAGDTYNYSPPRYDMFNEAVVESVEVKKLSNVLEEMNIKYKLTVPKELNEDRTSGSSDKVDIFINTTISVYKEINKILFNTRIENKASNHKIRIGFKVKSCNTHYSDTAFDLIKREVIRNNKEEVEVREELECNQHPTLSNIIANDIQIFHRGMQEYEVCEYKEEDYCFITAIRSVEDISRRDLRTRGGGAGPCYKVNGAKCLGNYEYIYGLALNDNINLNNKFIIRNEVLVKQSYMNKEERSLFNVDNNVVFSAFTLDREKNILLRLYNGSEKEVCTKVDFFFVPKLVSIVDFKGNIIENIGEKSSSLTLNIKGKKIVTLKIIK